MSDYQKLLFPYAYNILGSVEDAKDAIQEVMLKYTSKGASPDNEKNYLIKGVINQSLNLKRNLQKRQPQGQWLPEPVATEAADVALELQQTISYSLLYLLERLNPKQRAVFILKHAFNYNHQEIAEVLGISETSSRKLLSRAAAKLDQSKTTKSSVSPEQFQQIDHFTRAIRSRDLEELHQLLTDDIAFHADGGEKIKVVKKYCFGRSEVTDLLLYIYHRFQFNYRIRPLVVNHQPALLYYHRKKLILCQVFEFDPSGTRISGIKVILDQDKLTALSAKV